MTKDPPHHLSTQQLGLCINSQYFCRNLTLEFKPGQWWGIIGENGRGKTSLLHTLANLSQPTEGLVLLNQRPLSHYSHREIARHIGILLQDPQDDFANTVLETVLLGRYPQRQSWIHDGHTAIDKAMVYLHEVGLSTLSNRWVHTLSGGERQRLSIATLLMQEVDIYLLDEPVNHLDLRYQVQLLSLFKKMVAENAKTVLMVSHDLNWVNHFCSHVLAMGREGQIIAGKTDEILTTPLLENVYRCTLHCVAHNNHSIWIPDLSHS